MNTTDKIIKKIREYNDLSNFKRLKMLILRLSHKDIPTILNYLNAFNTTYAEEKKMNSSYLLKYLLENPSASEELVMEYFEVKKYNTFEKQVERLKEKIGYCLTSEVVTQRGDLSKASSTFHLALYKWSRANVYLGAKINLPEEAYNELSKIIQTCKTYEHYAPLVEALYMKRNFLMLRQGTKRFDELGKEIEHYEKCRDAYHRARQWHNEYMQYMDYEGYRSGSIQMFKKAIEQLKKDCAETQSLTITYFYLIIKQGYYQETRNFSLATEYALKLVNLVDEKNKAIYIPRRATTAYLHLAENYLCQKKFDQCLEAISTSRNYSSPSITYATGEELDFWALFYSGQYERAESKISSIITNVDYKESPIIENKRYYLYACSLFVLGKHKQCLKVLESVKEIHTDKRGWNIGIRILTIMVLLALNEEETLLHKLTSFKMHLKRLRELKEIRKRDIIIFKILGQLVRNNNDYAFVYGKMEDEFALLESSDPEYGWQIKGHELVIFQEWFKSSLAKEPYYLNLGAKETHRFAVV